MLDVINCAVLLLSRPFKFYSLGTPLQAESTLWNHCIRELKAELPEQQFNTWIRPLQAVEDGDYVGPFFSVEGRPPPGRRVRPVTTS